MGEVVRYVIAALIVAALVGFCIRNTDDTKVDYLVSSTNAPLFIVLAAAAVAGVLIAALLRRRRHHQM
jgi:MYXO-CTERM domain-containing protein